jgi:hypothetical protein
MPTLLPLRRPAGKPPRESFVFKSALIASALFFAALVMATAEFRFSAPGNSLSEIEAALRLAAR